MYYDQLWAIFLTAFGLAFIFTPVAIKIAPKIGAVDVPKDARRMHTKPMPRFGGMAIFIGTMGSMTVFLSQDEQCLGVMIGGILIYGLGVIDDLKNLSAKIKFLGQVAIASLMYFWGLRIEFMSNFFGEGNMDFGPAFSYLVTILWIVGITNAVNLIDGLDGLAAGIASISSLCIAYVAYIYGQYLPAAAMLALAGGALGFLPFNFHPAKIFMGDGGSLFLGFMLSTLSIFGLTKSAAVIATAVPIFVMGLPLFDTAFAIFRRFINGKPIMQADKGHMHHRLMQMGLGQRRATLMLYGLSAMMGIAAVMFARDLKVEGYGLIGVAIMHIYIFLTDSTNALPKILEGDSKRKYNMLEFLVPGAFSEEDFGHKNAHKHVGERAARATEKSAEILQNLSDDVDKNGVLSENDPEDRPE